MMAAQGVLERACIAVLYCQPTRGQGSADALAARAVLARRVGGARSSYIHRMFMLLAVSLAAAGATEASVSAAGAVSVAAPPWAQGGFTESAMANVSAVREQIKALPFLQELVAGTLPKASFAFYLTQDSLYLRQYSKVLAALASRAPTVAVTQNMARAADMALVVEGALHEVRARVRARVRVRVRVRVRARVRVRVRVS